MMDIFNLMDRNFANIFFALILFKCFDIENTSEIIILQETDSYLNMQNEIPNFYLICFCTLFSFL